METEVSNLTDKLYKVKDVCRIVNPKQQCLYIKNGVLPLEMYVSQDTRNGNDIIVMLFDKKNSFSVYEKWCNYELR